MQNRTAILAAYGFSTKRDPLAQLRALNLEVAAPSAPKNYPDPRRLVTADCIRPIARL